MKNYGILFLFFVLLISCNKNKEITFTIEGKVSDLTTNTPQSNGTLSLFKIKAGGGDIQLIEAIKPNTDGTYQFTFERDKSEKYELHYVREGYFDEIHSIYFSELSTNEPFKFDLTTETTSTIHWIVKNVAPSTSTEEVVIQKLNGRTTCPDCCANTSYTYKGININDTLSCRVNGNTYIKFYITELSQIPVLDSVYCPAFGEAYYSVNF